MTIKQFRTAARAADAEAVGEPLEVEIDGRKIVLAPPTSGQLALVMVGASDVASESESIAASINFFFGLLNRADEKYLRRRLFDRDDPFEIDQIAEVVEYAIEEWFGRPTKSPSDFLPSQRGSGKKSTAKQRKQASTPST